MLTTLIFARLLLSSSNMDLLHSRVVDTLRSPVKIHVIYVICSDIWKLKRELEIRALNPKILEGISLQRLQLFNVNGFPICG